MSIYVDNYMAPFGRLRLSHMIADTEEELDAMADRIGLKREWKQRGRHLHYDIGKAKRELAISYGAKSISCRELVRIANGVKPCGQDGH